MTTWKLLTKRPAQDEHRLFIDDRGRLSIADNSGSSPDTTDDGPLIIQPTGTCIARYWKGTVRVTMPVHVERTSESSRVDAHFDIYMAARRHFGRLLITLDDGLNEVIIQLRRLKLVE